MEDQPGKNIRAKLISVRHADLKPFDEGSFKRWCPICEKGVLLVRRDRKTFELLNLDRCTHCGQQLVYTDKTIGGEPVKNELPN